MDWVSVLGRLLLALVLVVAGIAKLADRHGSRQSLRAFRVPEGLVAPIALVLPAAEIALAVGLMFTNAARIAAIGAALLFAAFVFGIGSAIRRGEAPDCHCFGQLHSEPAGWPTVYRNLLLLALAVITASIAAVSIPDFVGERPSGEVVALALVGLVGVLVLYVVHLRSEMSVLTARLLELGAIPPGLPLGTRAPAATLTDRLGVALGMEDLVAPGRSVGLVFVSAGCAPCEALLPQVARWQNSIGASLPLHVVVAESADGGFVEPGVGHEARDLLIETGEVREAFGLLATPSAVIVARDQRDGVPTIAGTAIGPHDIEALIRSHLQLAAA